MSKKSTISHVPVGNGDMTLIKIASGDSFYTVLVDMNIRDSASDDDEQCDALSALHGLLEKDETGRPYVDVLLLTHPDQDHIRGFNEHFFRGKPEDYVSPKAGELHKIFVCEIWSSPLVFRRKSINFPLCQDAVDFNAEARRRVKLYRECRRIGEEGNRIRIIGEDENNKNDDIKEIVYKTDSVISKLNEVNIQELGTTVLGPLSDDEFGDDVEHDKNRSSIIMKWAIASHGYTNANNHILLGGDAGVVVWETLWDKYLYKPDIFQYDLLVAPHHCSWHTLSHDSFKESDDPKVSTKAKSALGQVKQGGVVVSSSNEIKNNDNDPPNHKAKEEYKSIVAPVSGIFRCLADHKPCLLYTSPSPRDS